MKLEEQLKDFFGFSHVTCENLNTLANDAFVINTPKGKFALKIYNSASRSVQEVQWEMDLTDHLIQKGAPIAKPIRGKDGFMISITFEGEERVAVLFEWAQGEKPKPEYNTYALLGKAAAQIHNAADSFESSLIRHEYNYDTSVLLDEQLQLMKAPLLETDQWQRVYELSERLKKLVANPALDYGICHMDLTLDNVHRDGALMTVFDLDSSGKCWRAYEPYMVLKSSKDKFTWWLEGYRSIREFGKDDEKAVSAFVILGDIRNIVWKLGFAKSSRGKPLMQPAELPQVVDEWLEWERKMM